MMRKKSILAVVLMICLIVSCKDNNPTSTKPEPNENTNTASQEIGPDGGEITSDDGNLTLTFPEGALPDTETITIGELSKEDLGSEFDELIDSLGISSAYELGPDGLQFDEPVTASMSADQNPMLNDSTLQLSISRLMFIASYGQGELLDSLRVEPAGDGSGNVQLSGELSHFSTFTVTETDETGLLTTTISGIPKQLQVGRTTDIDVRADVRLLEVEIPVFEPEIFLDDVFVPEDAQAGDDLAFPMPEVTPDTQNENFSQNVAYECDKKGQNPLNGSVKVRISEDQPGNLSDFFETERSLFVDFLAAGDVPETKCVEKTPSDTAPIITNFGAKVIGLTNVEYNLGFNYTGSIGNLQAVIDYGDGNSNQIANNDLKETSENTYMVSWEYKYGEIENYIPKVTATNTETDESDSKTTNLKVVTLNVSKDGDGSGTVTGSITDTDTPAGIDCGSDCVERYFVPSFISLKTAPADGSVFAGWSGEIGGADPESETISVTMDQHRDITAIFETESANASCTEQPLEPGIQFPWGGTVREQNEEGSTNVKTEITIDGAAEFVPGTEDADRGTWTTFTPTEGTLDIGTTTGGEEINFSFDINSTGTGSATYIFSASDEGGVRGTFTCDFIFE